MRHDPDCPFANGTGDECPCAGRRFLAECTPEEAQAYVKGLGKVPAWAEGLLGRRG